MTDFDPFANAPSSVNQPAAEQPVDDFDSMDQFLKSLTDAGWNSDLPSEPQEPSEDTSSDTEQPAADESQGVEHETEPTASSLPSAPSFPTVIIDNREVPLSEVTAYYELGKAIKDGNLIPQKQEPIPEPPAYEPPPIPEDFDSEDPIQHKLWSEIQDLHSQNHEMASTLQAIRGDYNRTRTERIVAEGIAAFRSEFPSLSEDELNAVRIAAGPLADSFVAISATPADGVKRAMYHAAIDNPTIREKLANNPPAPKKPTASETRKRKLGSLSPSGSAPRTGNSGLRPTNDREAVNAFASELAEAFQQNGRVN